MTKDLSFEDLLKFIHIFTLMADFGNRQQAISYAYDAMHPWVQAWT